MHTRSNPRPALCPQMRQDAFRDLCAVYDRFLDPRAEPMPENARLDVITYAQVLDVPVDHASDGGEVWRQVRPVLAMQMGPHADLLHDEGGEPTGKVFLPGSGRRAGLEGLAEPLAPLSLLVVEDDLDLSAAIVEALTEAGHLVAAATPTAEEAAALAAHHAIDFAIVDVELAGEADGVALAQRLHDRWGHKVLFVSGGPNAHLVGLPMALGFLGKPFSAAELLAAVTLSAALLRRGAA
jgi:CheY-like chemotaxis protein